MVWTLSNHCHVPWNLHFNLWSIYILIELVQDWCIYSNSLWTCPSILCIWDKYFSWRLVIYFRNFTLPCLPKLVSLISRNFEHEKLDITLSRKNWFTVWKITNFLSPSFYVKLGSFAKRLHIPNLVALKLVKWRFFDVFGVTQIDFT